MSSSNSAQAAGGIDPRIVSAAAVTVSLLLVIVAYEYREVSGLLAAITLLAGTIAWRARWLRALFTGIASLFLALTLAELLAPYLYSAPSNPNTLKGPLDYWVMTEVGAIGKEGKHRFTLTDRRGRVVYDVEYTIGEDGLRVTPVPPNLAHGEADAESRINFFGDSFTFGEGLPDDETLPYFTSKLTGLPVKNFGFHGYGVQQPLAILESDLDTSGAVNLLVTIPWHAQRTACKVVYSAGSPRYEISRTGEVVETGLCRLITDLGPIGKIVSRSNLYELYLAARSNEVNDEDYERYLALIGEMARISHDRDQEFVIGFIRADESWFKGTQFTNEAIYNRLSTLSDRIVDLTLATRSEALERKYYIDEADKHPSAIANLARAEIIKETLAHP